VAARAGAGWPLGGGHPASVTAGANAAMLSRLSFKATPKLLPLDPDSRPLDEGLFVISSHIISSSK